MSFEPRDYLRHILTLKVMRDRKADRELEVVESFLLARGMSRNATKLLNLDDGFTGVALDQDAALSGALTSVRIARGELKGPTFDVPSGGWVADPTTRLIQRKFSKNYITDHPRELLAYVDLNPMFPEVVWRRNLLDFLRIQPAPLPFERVWIFDYRKTKILLEYPNAIPLTDRGHVARSGR